MDWKLTRVPERPSFEHHHIKPILGEHVRCHPASSSGTDNCNVIDVRGFEDLEQSANSPCGPAASDANPRERGGSRANNPENRAQTPCPYTRARSRFPLWMCKNPR